MEWHSKETMVQGMFERTDPMKAWELKKLGSSAWQGVAKHLRKMEVQVDEPEDAKVTSSSSSPVR